MLSRFNFRLLAISGCLLFGGVTNISTSFAKEKDGGVNGGGGSKIESLFKTKALELSTSLMGFDKDSISTLGFDPNALFASLNETGGFFVLCAKDEKLKQIQTENKMARVFNEVPGSVFLNCTDFTTSQWEEKLNWEKLENAIFILHEALRVMDFAGEDNYGYSKNYINALKKEDQKYYNELISILNNEREHCDISINYHLTNTEVRFIYRKSSGSYQTLYSHTYYFQHFREEYLLNRSTEDGKKIYDIFVGLLKKVDCSN
jgi:hypothetical protein